MATQDDLEAEGRHGFSEEAEQDWIDASYKGVIEEKDLPPEIARDSEIYEALCTHTKDASAHHVKSVPGVTAHGDLTGLNADHHAHYHNDVRGDAKYLYRENVIAFTPDGDYEPATKKYVDDNVGAATLAALTDVVITGPADLDLLQYDVGSGKWVDRSLAEAGVAAASHAHAAGDITSGTFLDARIAQSNVTQHVGAIDHDSLLNFIANKHINHTSVTITTTEGIQGGGTIAANRTFKADVNGLAADGTPDIAADYVMTYDASASLHKKVLLNNLPGGGAHAASHAVGGGDTVFPADPGADKILQWDDSESALAWVDAGAPGAHTHDGDTLQLDGINSNGGAFSFATTGDITLNHSLILPANGAIKVTDGSPQIVFDNANNWLEITGKVGIGATEPGATLHTIGDFRLDSASALSLAGVEQTNRLLVLDDTTNSYVNLAHYSVLDSQVRGTIAISNSAVAWQNNFLALMVHGSTHAADNYLGGGADAGLALILAQGSEVTKLGVGTHGALPVTLFTNNIQRLTILPGGNVGLGTPTPGALLHISKVVDAGYEALRLDNPSMADSDKQVYLTFHGTDSVGTDKEVGKISAIPDSLNWVGGAMAFYTMQGGTPWQNAERMRISSAGNVGIGLVGPVAKLHVDQAATNGTIPVLILDQADVSEEMIEFRTTIGLGNTIEAVGGKALTVTHFLKVKIPDGENPIRYIPLGTIA